MKNFKTLVSIAVLVLVCLALFTGSAVAQTFPRQAAGVNVGLCPSCDPQIQGGVWYAKRITDNTHPTYWYSHVNIDKITVESWKPLKYQMLTSLETGVAQHAGKFGRFDIYGLTTGGIALDSTNTGLSFGGGGMATTPVGKNKNWLVGFYGGPTKTAIVPGTGWKFGLTFGYGEK